MRRIWSCLLAVFVLFVALPGSAHAATEFGRPSVAQGRVSRCGSNGFGCTPIGIGFSRAGTGRLTDQKVMQGRVYAANGLHGVSSDSAQLELWKPEGRTLIAGVGVHFPEQQVLAPESTFVSRIAETAVAPPGWPGAQTKFIGNGSSQASQSIEPKLARPISGGPLVRLDQYSANSRAHQIGLRTFGYDWSSTFTTSLATMATKPGAACELVEVTSSPKQLQAKFKHAGDFGVDGNYNPANAGKFSDAITGHINSPGVQKITGTYRGNPVTHYLDPSTGLNVIVDPSGAFVSGWKLAPAQLQNVLTHGGLT